MSTPNVSQQIIRNTRSNYVLIAVRMALGLITFRLLYNGLSKEAFGFWAFLWGVFGTSVLLDFGFGLTIQKQVAQLSVKRAWDELSRVLTTLLTLYVGLAIAIVLGAWLIAPTIVARLAIAPENQSAFGSALFWFLAGMGLSFPLGVLPEILKGQQRISTANNLVIIGNVCSFALVLTALNLRLELKWLVLFSMLSILIPHVFAGILGLRSLPEVRLHPRFFTPRMIGETLRFSASAYLILVSYMILTKTDQLVIGSVASIAAVALYQPAAKIGEIFGLLTRQIANTLQPAAAQLHAQSDTQGLRRLLLDGTRYSVMLAAPLYLMTAAFMAPVLQLLTGDKSLPSDAIWSAHLLVFWAFSFIITHNVYKRVAVMTGQEKRLVWVGIGEAVMNLVLSVSLLYAFQKVYWVAAATLVSSLFFGCVFLWPWAAKVAELSPIRFAQATLGRNFLGSLPLLVTLGILLSLPGLDPKESFVTFVGMSTIAAGAAAIGLWTLSLTPEDRKIVQTRWLKRFPKNNP